MKIISYSEFKNMIGALIGKDICPYNGYGSYLMLELGDRAVCFEFHWRIEGDNSILLGWNNSRSYIESKLNYYVKHSKIHDIRIDEHVRELIVELENGKIIRSITSYAGFPYWYIKIADKEYIHNNNGEIVISDGSSIESAFEVEDLERANEIENRWSKQLKMELTNSEGCGICQHVIRLEANFGLRELALCANQLSENDKCIVHIRNKCNLFQEKN